MRTGDSSILQFGCAQYNVCWHGAVTGERTVHNDGLSGLREVDPVSGGDCLLSDSHGWPLMKEVEMRM